MVDKYNWIHLSYQDKQYPMDMGYLNNHQSLIWKKKQTIK